MTLEELIRELKKIGTDYPKKGDYFFRNNQAGATQLTKICNMTGKFTEEIVQQKLLLELRDIFSALKSSSVLSTQVRDKLVQYDAFKDFDKHWKGGSSKKSPTAQQMVEALDSLGTILSRRYELEKNIAMATKIEMKP